MRWGLGLCTAHLQARTWALQARESSELAGPAHGDGTREPFGGLGTLP